MVKVSSGWTEVRDDMKGGDRLSEEGSVGTGLITKHMSKPTSRGLGSLTRVTRRTQCRSKDPRAREVLHTAWLRGRLKLEARSGKRSDAATKWGSKGLSPC